ncbi:RTA1 like protein-domain-containing protein [Mucor mucedo]|uniref:RTA1 like protein-domain-containing protein n=1 Tax=Mucor mucedo TaxID=29922 RepID=UPI00221E6A75|nr:RTA1 like protein-domain-containing protein [Mucor mucedo]KAI7890127.1 RTA1 like protein-domain-containing protein [Mucor mucedo]
MDLVYLYFHYYPNAPVAYVALAIFAIIDIYLILRIITQKAPSFMFKLIILATVETLGFVIRILCIKTDVTFAKFLIMNIFMLLAPNILAIVNYNTIAHILTLANIETDKIYLKSKPITIFFIACTITSSMFQAVGGSIQALAQYRVIGPKLAITGLSLQLSIFVLFTVLATYVYRKNSIQYYVKGVDNPKKKVITRIYIVLALMAIRVIYRLAQFATGGTGIIATHEWALYVFDPLIVATCFLIFSTFNTCFPKRDEEDVCTLEDLEIGKEVSSVVDIK